MSGRSMTVEMLERIVVAPGRLLITIAGTTNNEARTISQWSPKSKDSVAKESDIALQVETRNQGLVQSIARGHVWLRSLGDGTCPSVEQLAENIGLHAKVVRQALRLAFLAPEITSAILEGRQSATLSLAQIPKLLPLSWTEQQRLLS